MERRVIPEAETKLTILYSLDKLGPATDVQLLQFLVEYDLMNYFAMQLSLSEMAEQGQIGTHPHAAGALITVTDAGAYTLRAFMHRVPASRRALIDREAPAWHARFRAEQEAPAEAEPLPEGGTRLRLRLMARDAAILDLRLALPGVSQKPFLQARWQAAAQGVYAAITRLLAADYDPAAAALPLPDTAALGPAERDWLLSLADRAQDPRMTLALTLPDEHLARHYAAVWPDRCVQVRQDILRRLREAMP